MEGLDPIPKLSVRIVCVVPVTSLTLDMRLDRVRNDLGGERHKYGADISNDWRSELTSSACAI
jgi:hypothetical protein